MRVVSWNVENATRCLPSLPVIVEEQLGRPDVLCVQELRIRQSDAAAIGALEKALPGYDCHYSLPRDSRNVTFRGGRMYGVATFVRTDWRGEVPDWDLEGRVVVVRKDRLAIVNVYAVNGTSKPYMNAEGHVAGDRHELKRRFQSQVMDLARELRKHGAVIMAGDWNVSNQADEKKAPEPPGGRVWRLVPMLGTVTIDCLVGTPAFRRGPPGATERDQLRLPMQHP